MADCYPMLLRVRRRKGEDVSLIVGVRVLMPDWKKKRWEGGLEPCASFELKLRLGAKTFDGLWSIFDGCSHRGWLFFGGKSWEETFH
jgi:hypothetical protein